MEFHIKCNNFPIDSYDFVQLVLKYDIVVPSYESFVSLNYSQKSFEAKLTV